MRRAAAAPSGSDSELWMGALQMPAEPRSAPVIPGAPHLLPSVAGPLLQPLCHPFTVLGLSSPSFLGKECLFFVKPVTISPLPGSLP